eukprot:GHVO01038288.1.p1 GENE.GHVO01038288.1~~GHVO01038288.1.p1  ORF type:complete len:230 (+),score=7.45 GHVO01038288.1:602-1291(+)
MLLSRAEAFFPEVTIEPEVFYLVQSCSQLTPQQKQSIKESFLQMLTSYGVCQSSGDVICQTSDVSIRCGQSRRVKRSVQHLSIRFKLKTERTSVHHDPQCYEQCSTNASTDCFSNCVQHHIQQSRRRLSVASNRLLSLFALPPGRSPSTESEAFSISRNLAPAISPEQVSLNIAGMRLTAQGGVGGLGIHTDCGDGMTRATNGYSCGTYDLFSFVIKLIPSSLFPVPVN